MKTITVKELIRHLEKSSPQATVVFWDDDTEDKKPVCLVGESSATNEIVLYSSKE